MEKALNYIDIFAGCGGLSTGLFNAGWHGLFAVEKNADAFSTLNLILSTLFLILFGLNGSPWKHMI